MQLSRVQTLQILLILLALTACNFSPNDETPTAEGIFEEPINPLPEVSLTTEASPSWTPSLMPTPLVEIVTSTLAPTEIPSETPVPTETPGPWEYIIQPGDSLGGIIQRSPHNYQYDSAVIDAVVRLNSNISNADVLPPPGTSILIPRPTPVTIITGVDAEGNPITSEQNPSTRDRIGVDGPIGCHEVREGQTVIGIVEEYGGMTLEILSQLNSDLNFSRCNFEEPSGGESCNVIVFPGQCVNVLLPTATPTLSPTPSGNETPTLTPTYRAPSMISPPNGVIYTGSSLSLHWDSIGVLDENEYYLVQVTNRDTGITWNEVTRNTSIRVAVSVRPPAGETHEIDWRVTVAAENAQGAYQTIGDPGAVQTFSWQR